MYSRSWTTSANLCNRKTNLFLHASCTHIVSANAPEQQLTKRQLTSTTTSPAQRDHHTLHSTLRTLHFTLHTPHSTLYTLQLTLYTPHTLQFTNSTLLTLHSTLHTLHFPLHTPHSTLSTPQCRLVRGEIYMYKTVQINYCRKVFCVTAYPCVSTSVPLTYV